MARVMDELNEPNQPDPEVPVRVIVPQEFAGFSMTELASRRGAVLRLEVQSGVAFIRGTLPSSEYDALETAIAVSTQHRGKVEHELDNTD